MGGINQSEHDLLRIRGRGEGMVQETQCVHGGGEFVMRTATDWNCALLFLFPVPWIIPLIANRKDTLGIRKTGLCTGQGGGEGRGDPSADRISGHLCSFSSFLFFYSSSSPS